MAFLFLWYVGSDGFHLRVYTLPDSQKRIYTTCLIFECLYLVSVTENISLWNVLWNHVFPRTRKYDAFCLRLFSPTCESCWNAWASMTTFQRPLQTACLCSPHTSSLSEFCSVKSSNYLTGLFILPSSYHQKLKTDRKRGVWVMWGGGLSSLLPSPEAQP